MYEKDNNFRVLYFSGGTRGCNSRIHSNFFIKLKNVCDLKIYGPKEIDIINDKNICSIKYNAKISANDLIDELHPDVLLFHGIGASERCHVKDLNKAKIPMVFSVGDYYSLNDYCKKYEGTDKWLNKYGIDFITTRGPYRNCITRSVWLPFSANEDEFFTNLNDNYFKNRKKDIGFVGSTGVGNKYYNTRRKAIETLEINGLLNKEDIRHINDEKEYATALKQYKILLSCSFPPLYNPPAKTFEIMASGAALLTTKIKVKEELFGKEKCFFEYKEDMSDICDVVKYMKNNLDEVEEVTRNALSIINEKHLDKHRIIELYNILKNVVNGNSIENKWGYYTE